MVNRDSLVLILGIAASVLGYFISAEVPPTQWTYAQWLQFGSAMVGIILAWLRSSPLAGIGEPSKSVLGIVSKKVQ